jgi:hypothetical protein
MSEKYDILRQMRAEGFSPERLACDHCWHIHQGPLMMVIPDGHMVQSCCKCKSLRTIHCEHIGGRHE